MKREPFDPDVTADQIERYLAGVRDADETARVQAYLARHPALEHYHRVLHIALQPSLDPGTIDVERAFLALRTDPLTGETPAQSHTPSSRPAPLPVWHRRRNPRRIWRHGAYVAGATLTAFALVLVVGSRWHEFGLTSRATSDFHVYRTNADHRAALTLSDGSHVTLAPNTTLSVSSKFGSTTRDVTLVGEAYFEVTSDTHTPFLVHTGKVTTRVLGTAFDVKRYRDDPYVRVVVTSGRVSAGGRRTPVLLSAGTLGRVTDSTALATTVPDTKAYTGWTQGRLAFWNTPVSDVLRTVGQWYGLEFRLDDSTLASREVTITLDQKTEAEALRILNSLLNVTPTFGPSRVGASADGSGRIVTLHHRARSSAHPRYDISDSLVPYKEVGR